MRLGFHGASSGSIISGALTQGLTQLGHTVSAYRSGGTFDYVFLVNVSNHGQNYTYGQLPDHPRLVFVDTAEYGPLTHDDPKYAYAFSSGSLAHKEKNQAEQLRLQRHLTGRSFPYFLRELQLKVSYPDSYHPIDYPMLAPFAPPQDWQVFKSRPYDFLCVWGLSHPWRSELDRRITLHRDSQTSLKFRLGARTLDFFAYMNEMERSVSTVSFDGYGSGSFRVTEALTRCVLFIGPLHIRQRLNFVDGVNCVQYRVVGRDGRFVETDLLEVAEMTLADRRRCFDIYQAGRKLAADTTCEAWSRYVLDVCARHDWNKPTSVDFDPCCVRAGS